MRSVSMKLLLLLRGAKPVINETTTLIINSPDKLCPKIQCALISASRTS
jgi:hypothetical protein